MKVIRWCLIAAAHTRKIIKNGERGENLLENGILLHLVFRFSQIALKVKIYVDEKLTFMKEAWHLTL